MFIPKVFMYLTPHDGHFRNFPIFNVNVIWNSRDNAGINLRHLQVINMTEYGALFIINNCFYDTPVILVSLISHLF